MSPLFARSFDGVPPAYVVTMGNDVLRDDGLLLVQRLRAQSDSQSSTRSEVPRVTHRHYANKYHIWFRLCPEQIVRDLREFRDANAVW